MIFYENLYVEINMSEPKSNESQNEFISRCVSEVMSEGKTQKQALGQCYCIWRQHKKKSLFEIVESLQKIFKKKCKK